MYMHSLDWIIFAVVAVGIIAVAASTRKYTKSVADFLAANRSAGRYLLCISEGMAGLGAITVVNFFEVYYNAGFTALWWGWMGAPIGLVIALSGFVIYRFRETRALTLAQFFEIRYSRGFRIYAGTICWISGIINFGIFPAVGARFFINYCGLPANLLGIPTFPLLMIILLVISLGFVFLGGQIAVMVTDFLQGLFTNIVFLMILAVFAYLMPWDRLIHVAVNYAPENASLVNPFKTSNVEDFNVWFFLIGAIAQVYVFKSWQGAQAYNSSAKNPHEAKMAGVIAVWRMNIQTLFLVLLPLFAFAILHDPEFADLASNIRADIDAVTQLENAQMGKQMTVPLTLAHVMPLGILGLFAAVMFCAFVSTHDTYLHSWGSIFVQDVLLPMWQAVSERPRWKTFFNAALLVPIWTALLPADVRGRVSAIDPYHITPRTHMWLLRISILSVAAFIFFFSLLFQQNQYIMMFFQVTGAIWAGGAGAVIIGGLYWKRGCTSAAFTALTVGWVIAVFGMIIIEFWEQTWYPMLEANAPFVLDWLRLVFETPSQHVPGLNWNLRPDRFPLNGNWFFFFSIVFALSSYIGISYWSSLVSKRPDFEMDEMLHRGEYAIEGEHGKAVVKPVTGLRAILPTKEFTFGDKLIYYGNLAYTLGMFTIFVIGTLYGLTHRDMSDGPWVTFWTAFVGFCLVAAVLTVIWFLIGGIRDIREMFHTLRTVKRDLLDDGRVLHKKGGQAGKPGPAK